MLAIKINDWKNQPHSFSIQEGDNVLTKVTEHNSIPGAGVATITVQKRDAEPVREQIYVDWSKAQDLVDDITEFLVNSDEAILTLDMVSLKSLNKSNF